MNYKHESSIKLDPNPKDNHYLMLGIILGIPILTIIYILFTS